MALDYQTIFNETTEELARLGYTPVAGTVNQEENDRIDAELSQRIELLQTAMEELRIKFHATSEAKDNNRRQMTNKRREELAASDMNHRQTKQAEKIDRAVGIKKLQAAELTKSLTAIGMGSDEIRAILEKKGLV